MKLIAEFSREQLRARIPYALICETKEGSRWNTGTRRRKWAELTDEPARRRFRRLFSKARMWSLTKGPPETTRMTMSELSDWDFLASFCANL